MSNEQTAQLLTAEVIDALARNAESIKSVISSNDEMAVLGKRINSCCCPSLVKFKFVLCNVWIDVNNAACPGSVVGPCGE